MRTAWNILTIGLICACLPLSAADLVGTVTHESGSLLPNAKVTVFAIGEQGISPDAKPLATMETDERGEFRFQNLPVGTVRVKVSLLGFRNTTFSAELIEGALPLRVPVGLEVLVIGDIVGDAVPSAEIRGLARHRDGSPASWAKVCMETVHRNEPFLTQTRANRRGEFTIKIENMSSTYRLVAYDAGSVGVAYMGVSWGDNSILIILDDVQFGKKLC